MTNKELFEALQGIVNRMADGDISQEDVDFIIAQFAGLADQVDDLKEALQMNLQRLVDEPHEVERMQKIAAILNTVSTLILLGVIDL